MFERIVLVKLNEEYCSDAGREEFLHKSSEILSSIPGVRSCRVGGPADEASAASWDVIMTLSFDSTEDIESYRVHPTHSDYLENFMAPRAAVKKVWNFEMRGDQQ